MVRYEAEYVFLAWQVVGILAQIGLTKCLLELAGGGKGWLPNLKGTRSDAVTQELLNNVFRCPLNV